MTRKTVSALDHIWQRAHLLATARGLAGRPCSEAVDTIDHEKAHEKPALRATLLGRIVGDPAWQPAVVFYMGYPTLTARASPRRPVESVVSCCWLVSVSGLHKRKRIETVSYTHLDVYKRQ